KGPRCCESKAERAARGSAQGRRTNISRGPKLVRSVSVRWNDAVAGYAFWMLLARLVECWRVPRKFLGRSLMKRLALVLLCLAVISGCTSQSNQPAPKPEPKELQTGRSAFQRLYVAARGWA